MPLIDFQRLKGNDARESKSLQTDLENVVVPRCAPICADREKIVASDVLVCEMANVTPCRAFVSPTRRIRRASVFQDSGQARTLTLRLAQLIKSFFISRVAEFAEGTGFQLAGPLLRYAQRGSDLFERLRLVRVV